MSPSEKQRKQFPHILAALHEQPWAITEGWLVTMESIVARHANGTSQELVAALKTDNDDDRDADDLEMAGDTAIIRVMGPIFPRANLMTRLSGATSSADVSYQLDMAIEQATSIAMVFDSPGGAVSGGFEVADKIYNIRETVGMPIVAVVEGTAASLAYLWASQCDECAISQSSIVGSVSVVMRSASDDRAQRNEGIDIVTMKSGNLKQANDPAALAFAGQYSALLGQLNTYHDMFVSSVQRARPMMDMSKVSTGDVWIGQKAIAAGLADRIADLSQVISELQ